MLLLLLSYSSVKNIVADLCISEQERILLRLAINNREGGEIGNACTYIYTL